VAVTPIRQPHEVEGLSCDGFAEWLYEHARASSRTRTEALELMSDAIDRWVEHYVREVVDAGASIAGKNETLRTALVSLRWKIDEILKQDSNSQ
jgi:hypothetical protein